MHTTLLSLALVAVLAACSTQPSGSGAEAPECQTLRGMMGRGDDQRVQEACTRQLGAEGCQRCLSGGR